MQNTLTVNPIYNGYQATSQHYIQLIRECADTVHSTNWSMTHRWHPIARSPRGFRVYAAGHIYMHNANED